MNEQATLSKQDTVSGDELEKLLQLFSRYRDDEKRVVLATYRLLAQGHPVSRTRISEQTGLDSGAVEKVLHYWPGFYREEKGEIVGFWGLTCKSISPHEMQVDRVTMWAWCAWDTLFIPPLLGTQVKVRSLSPLKKRSIAFDVGADGVINQTPQKIYVSFLLPPDDDWRQDVVLSFCHYVHFFADATEARDWANLHPGSVIVSIEAAYKVGRRKNALQFGEGGQ